MHNARKIAYNTLVFVAIIFVVMAVAVLVSKFVSWQKNKTNTVKMTTVLCNFDKKDIGTVKSDTTLSFIYRMQNTGKDSLRVLYVSPDCNCTGYKLSKRIAGVGDSIMLTLNVDMRNKHDGRFMLSTVVGLNTEQREHIIIVEGNVVSGK